MITLKNNVLTVLIDEMGAQIRSVKKNDVEYMWQADPQIWKSTAPLMFPICGGLKDDKFVYEGKEYILPKHGFARNMPFTVEKADDTSAVFCLKADEETRKMYPFEFELRLIYNIENDALTLKYEVKNVGENTMYFAIGSHEGYYTPEGIEDYDIVFPQNETLNSVMVDGNLLQDHTLPIIKNTNVLPLYDKYFLVDCLVFKDVKSKSLLLRNRRKGKSIKIDFPDAAYLVLWHPHCAPFLCVEPWSGIPDDFHSDYNLAHKEGITALSKGEVYTAVHTITYIGEE
ncbi:MAG: aldose 1-epimerase family protein [Ruminococcaceae bacterium]|nr:aldose 1-epimerase family protein [Oscillospiraceae bacterium]